MGGSNSKKRVQPSDEFSGIATEGSDTKPSSLTNGYKPERLPWMLLNGIVEAYALVSRSMTVEYATAGFYELLGLESSCADPIELMRYVVPDNEPRFQRIMTGNDERVSARVTVRSSLGVSPAIATVFAVAHGLKVVKLTPKIDDDRL